MSVVIRETAFGGRAGDVVDDVVKAVRDSLSHVDSDTTGNLERMRELIENQQKALVALVVVLMKRGVIREAADIEDVLSWRFQAFDETTAPEAEI